MTTFQPEPVAGEAPPPDSVRPAATSARAQMRASRAGRAAVIDGALTDETWRDAPRIGGFVQRDPDEGKAATESTTVRRAGPTPPSAVATRIAGMKSVNVDVSPSTACKERRSAKDNPTATIAMA